jgi:hypothetical protein
MENSSQLPFEDPSFAAARAALAYACAVMDSATLHEFVAPGAVNDYALSFQLQRAQQHGG